MSQCGGRTVLPELLHDPGIGRGGHSRVGATHKVLAVTGKDLMTLLTLLYRLAPFITCNSLAKVTRQLH